MTRIADRVVLAVLGGFVALSAIPSAFLVVPTLPREFLLRGPFTDFTVPAVALGLVGVLAALAVAAAFLRPTLAAATSALAGLAIIGFELVQIWVVGLAVITYGAQHPQSWLQFLYLAIGVAQVALAYRVWGAVGRPLPRKLPGPLTTYFSLAFGITWFAIVIYLLALDFDLAGLTSGQVMVMMVFMLAGPPLAGAVATAVFDGRAGFRSLWAGLRRVRVPMRWYLFALAPVPVLLVVILFPLATWVSPDYLPVFVPFGIAAGLLAGLFEELGWTGFATRRLLRRYSPLAAGLLLGLLWALWHALADFAGNAAAMGFGEWVLRLVIFWIVPLTSYRVLMTWAFAHHRSLALAMVMHAGYSGWLATFTMGMPAATGGGALLWQALFALGIVAVAAAVVVRAPDALRRPGMLPAPA